MYAPVRHRVVTEKKRFEKHLVLSFHEFMHDLLLLESRCS